MCKCVIAILLADLLTLSMLYTSFIELNKHDPHYNIFNVFRTEYEDETKEEARLIMSSFLTALLVHTLATIIKYIYQLVCCCDLCCCSCGNHYDNDVIVYA